MGFPYLAPLKKWTKDVLEDRERSPNFGNLKMPFAVMSSTALVLKSNPTDTQDSRKTTLADLYRNPNQKVDSAYHGCIISNFLHKKDNYSTGKTIVGYDFNGNPIRIESETNRRISPPIIESVEIDTDGANNTLKTARVSVKCFSLKQLELFEMFFLKPGIYVVVEFGDGSLLRRAKNKPSNQPIGRNDLANQNLKTGGNIDRGVVDSIESELFVNKYAGYDSFINAAVSQSLSKAESIQNYLLSAEKTLGTYDYVSGKVVEFSYSVEDNGVYAISLEVCQSNQFTLAIPHNFNKSEVKSAVSQKSANLYEQISTQLKYDLNISDINISGSNSWQKEFFNWGALNLKQKDELVSLKSYISFRFVLKVLANYTVGSISEFAITPETHNVGGTDMEYIPVRSHRELISSSEVILFPGSLPSITGSSTTNKIIVDDKNRQNFKINGYSFNEDSDKVVIKNKVANNTIVTVDDGYVIGNALNCFILYEEIVKIWRNSFTRLDFIEAVLSLINENSYGLFELRFASSTETSKATIIDVKMSKSKIESNEPIYRFKPTTINSIVRNFTFNMELSNMIAGRTVFNAQNFIKEAINTKKTNEDDLKKDLQEKTLKHFDMSQYSSYDGYYTINKVDLLSAKLQEAEYIKQIKSGVVQNDPNKDDTATSTVDLTSLIKDKSRSFKLDNQSTKIAVLVFTDKTIISDNIYKKLKDLKKDSEPIKSILTPIEVTVTIDGMSGFSCGEYFHIDGVPETYNRDGVFQITNIKHSVTDQEWTTTLEAGWRIVN